MKREISLNEPHITLFLTDMQRRGRSILKLGDCLFEVRRRDEETFVISGIKKDGKKEEILLVSLLEIFELPFEVLDLEVLEQLFEKV